MKGGTKTSKVETKAKKGNLMMTSCSPPVEIGTDSLNNSVGEGDFRRNLQVEKPVSRPSSSCELIKKVIGFSIKAHADSIIELIADDLIKEVIPILNIKERNQQIAEEKQRRRLLALLLETHIEEFQKTRVEVAQLTAEIIDLEDLQSNSQVYLKRKAESVQISKVGLSLQQTVFDRGQSFKATRDSYIAKNPCLQSQFVEKANQFAEEILTLAIDELLKTTDSSMYKLAQTCTLTPNNR